MTKSLKYFEDRAKDLVISNSPYARIPYENLVLLLLIEYRDRPRTNPELFNKLYASWEKKYHPAERSKNG